MSQEIIAVKLNQQQIELLDATRAKYPEKDRAGIILHALHEYCAKLGIESSSPTKSE